MRYDGMPTHTKKELVLPSPCERGCPHADKCYELRLCCEAWERYYLDGDTAIKPSDPTHERYLRLNQRRDRGRGAISRAEMQTLEILARGTALIFDALEPEAAK